MHSHRSQKYRGIFCACHMHIFHTFFITWSFPHSLHIFFGSSHIFLMTSVSAAQKIRECSQNCWSALPHKKYTLIQKTTEQLEWPEWHVLNSYEHKDCVELCTRPFNNLNSYLRNYCLSILNSYSQLEQKPGIFVFMKDIFVQKLVTQFLWIWCWFTNINFLHIYFEGCFLCVWTSANNAL
jgi:hypothetical protein